MKKLSERQSNIELLRILCMLFVLLFHFNLNAILRNEETSQSLVVAALLVNSLVVVAVNCFVLISGFFSIKLKTKSVLSYLIHTEFYAFLAVLFYVAYSILVSQAPLFTRVFFLELMPFHPSGLWFVPCYALLMVISPLLNRICEDKKTHILTMIIIACGEEICYIAKGYSGYDIFNFILMYLIGRWIAHYAKDNRKKKQGRLAAFVLFLSVFLTFLLSMLWISKGYRVYDKTMFAYCSPWVIFSSISLFLVFKNMSITKRWVYYVSPSVFSVYLFHENSLIREIVYIMPLRQIISVIYYDSLSYLVMIIYGLLMFALIVVFDRYVRIRIQELIMDTLIKIRVLRIIDLKLLKLNE